MQISEKTLLADCADVIDFLTEDSVKELKKQAENLFGACWELTFRQFFACTEKDFSSVGIDIDNLNNMTVLAYFWVARFKDFAEEFSHAVEQLTIPTSNEAKMASKACLQTTFQESVLISCREYFGLHSFDDVYNITVSDFIIMRKDIYNKAIFEQRMQQINEQKYKTK